MCITYPEVKTQLRPSNYHIYLDIRRHFFHQTAWGGGDRQTSHLTFTYKETSLNTLSIINLSNQLLSWLKKSDTELDYKTQPILGKYTDRNLLPFFFVFGFWCFWKTPLPLPPLYFYQPVLWLLCDSLVTIWQSKKPFLRLKPSIGPIPISLV